MPRIGLLGRSLAESAVLRSGLAPTSVYLAFVSLYAARTMMAGVRLGVFDALARSASADGGKRGKTAEGLARELSCDPAGMELLLDALVGFGHLKRVTKHGSSTPTRYRNRWVIDRWFTRSSPLPLRNTALFFYDVWELLGSLEDAVRGHDTDVLDLHDARRPPEFWDRYLRGLGELALQQTWEMVRRVPMPAKPTSLLDIGGGHGMFSVAFCRHHPTLRAEVLDLPGAIEVGTRMVAEQRMSHRVRFREGDLRTADLGRGHDAILLFIVVHHFDPSELARLFARVLAALRPGGTLAIFEPEYRDAKHEMTQYGGMMALMFFLTSRERLYDDGKLTTWLGEAGFERIRTLRPLSLATNVLITARRPP